MAKTILYNKRTSEGISIPDFKLNYRAWHWHKNIQVDQWNQIKDADVNSHTYRYLIFFILKKKSQKGQAVVTHL